MGEVIGFPKKSQQALYLGVNASNIAYNDGDIREQLIGFYEVFPEIKKTTEEILLNGKNKNTRYLKKPYVSIITIAKGLGLIIKEASFNKFFDIIREVGFEDAYKIQKKLSFTKHAFLIKERGIILLNKDDPYEEKLFSIAHEIFHYIYWKYLGEKMPFITEKKESWTRLLKDQPIIEKIGHVEYSEIAARINIEKQRKLKNWLQSAQLKLEDTCIDIIKAALAYDIEDKIEDEIADYFAANLLVPTERFILREDKSDYENALAFKVVKECIYKRRKEINHELEFMASDIYDDIEPEEVSVFPNN